MPWQTVHFLTYQKGTSKLIPQIKGDENLPCTSLNHLAQARITVITLFAFAVDTTENCAFFYPIRKGASVLVPQVTREEILPCISPNRSRHPFRIRSQYHDNLHISYPNSKETSELIP